MMLEVKKSLPVDIAVCAAAVSDYKPITKSKNKIKKDSFNNKEIKLEKNLDILEYLGKTNKDRPKIVIGFSAETENLIVNSKKKIKEKYCDLIIANDVSKEDSGFESDYNEVVLYYKDLKKKKEKLSFKKKSDISEEIVDRIINQIN